MSIKSFFKIIILTTVLMGLEGVSHADIFCIDDSSDGPATPAHCDATCADGSHNCTLRDALQANRDNNNQPNVDSIIFKIPGPGPHVIQPVSQLPVIDEPASVDGYTQPGSSVNTLANGNNAVIKIILDGALAIPSSMSEGINGIEITGGHTTIRGLMIYNFQAATSGADGGGIIMFNVDNNTDNLIEGNFIGTDGSSELLNDGTGIVAVNKSFHNTVGGPTLAARNVVSGNGRNGVEMDSVSNTVQGNFIGTDRTGTLAIGNGINGVLIAGGQAGNIIAENLISGNGTNGIFLIENVTGTQIKGNRIGTDVTGTQALGNEQNGILLQDQFSGLPSGNFIGGTTGVTPGGACTGDCNLIAFNHGAGIFLNDGANIAGGPDKNSILGNSIFSNDQLGTDLGSTGVDPNDPLDSDTGANNLQNFPDLVSATVGGGLTVVAGSLSSAANTTFHLEFFANQDCDPSGNGEGETFLGSQDVVTDGGGLTNFSASVLSGGGDFLTSTATDPNGNTSEFSNCIQTQPAPDSDGDGVPDTIDVCPNDPDPSQEDNDGDGVGDACDQCQGQDDLLDNNGDGTPDCLQSGNFGPLGGGGSCRLQAGLERSSTTPSLFFLILPLAAFWVRWKKSHPLA